MIDAEDSLTPFVVAGIPFVHRADPGLQLPKWITPAWRGGQVTDEPIIVHHAFGDTDVTDLFPLLEDAPPYGEYFVDGEQRLAIRSRGMGVSGDLPQLLRTRRSGFEYLMSYSPADDTRRLQWGWHRTIFMFALPARLRGLVVHATGLILPGGVGVLCPGVSGDGKSTLARTMLAEPMGRVKVLGDDRIAITAESSRLTIWGTPWHSSAETARADHAPLRALVFVRPGSGSAVAALSARAAGRRLLRTVAIPFWDPKATEFALDLVERVVAETPAFEFTYAPAPIAASTLVERLTAALGPN